MDALLKHLPEIALAAGLAWGSGLRLYATLFALGIAGWLGWIDLPSHLGLLAHPLVLWSSGFMALVEFGADKLPWLDSAWDAVHTFIRIPAGAALAAAVFGDGAAALTAAILGGTLAAGTHLAKAGGRALINVSPEPFSNWTASFTEDAAVLGGLWLAILQPAAFLAVLLLAAGLVLLLFAFVRNRLRTARGGT